MPYAHSPANNLLYCRFMNGQMAPLPSKFRGTYCKDVKNWCLEAGNGRSRVSTYHHHRGHHHHHQHDRELIFLHHFCHHDHHHHRNHDLLHHHHLHVHPDPYTHNSILTVVLIHLNQCTVHPSSKTNFWSLEQKKTSKKSSWPFEIIFSPTSCRNASPFSHAMSRFGDINIIFRCIRYHRNKQKRKKKIPFLP